VPLASKVQAWVWILIYAGLIRLGLGLSVQRSDAALGWGLVMVGLAGIAIGGVLVWVRTRMKN
jgi:hypothetical protein